MTDLIDRDVAARFAARFAQPGALDRSYLLHGLQDHFAELVAEAEPLIAEEAGFTPAEPAVARVLSREEWASNNVDSMLQLMAPLLERVEERRGSQVLPAARTAYRSGLGAQLGVVLGFLSQRVLGQYDILMEHQHQVWFVGPNVVMIERRFGFVPRDFRLWITLHELTHRAQFEANPWVRPYFLAQVRAMLDSMEVDAKALVDRLVASVRAAVARDDGTPLVFRVLNPQQLEVFNRLQAFMSVIEGHGNFVMDRVAEGRIPSQPRMSQTLRGGGTVGTPLAKLMAKVLGFELKKAQYIQGQKFMDAVFAEAGPPGIRAVFASADALPSLEEVRAPQQWLRRVGP